MPARRTATSASLVQPKPEAPRNLISAPYDISHTGFVSYFNSYMTHLQVINYAQTTQRRTDSKLRRFIGWCDDMGLMQPAQVTKPMLERYQRHLYHYRQANGEPLSVATQLSYLMTVKQFFKWLSQQNHVLYNPAADLIMPKQPVRLPVVLSVEDIRNLLQQPDTQTPLGIRDRAILELFYATGMRRSELQQLTIPDVLRTQNTLWVRQGKGDKDRVLPVGSHAMHWLGRYLDEVRDKLLTNRYDQTVFLNNYGTGYAHTKLGSVVKHYLNQAGIHVKGSCHLLRHAMATHMLENGAELRYIQAMLGHADIRTTQVYTHVAIHQLRQVHERTHPLGLEQQ